MNTAIRRVSSLLSRGGRTPLPPVSARLQSTERGGKITYAGVSFRKTDGALQLRVVQPKFAPVKAGSTLHRIAYDGYISIQVAAVGEGGKVENDSAASVNLYATDVVTLVQSPIAQPLTINERAKSPASDVRLDIAPATPAVAAAAGKPASPGTFKVTVTREGEEPRSVTIAQNELFLVRNLAGVSLPWIAGWQVQLDPSLFDPAVHMLEVGREGGVSTPVTQGGFRQAPAPYSAPPPPPTYPGQGGGFSNEGGASSSSSSRNLGHGMKVVERKSGKGPILVREPPPGSGPEVKADFAPMPSTATFATITADEAFAAFDKAAQRRPRRVQ